MQQTLLSGSGRPAGASAPLGLPARAALRGPRSRVPGLSLLVVLVGYPLLWALGVQVAAWPVCALLLAVGLVARGRAPSVPTGFGLWLLFLAWTFVSALVLQGGERYLAWTYRETLYLSATVVLVFLVSTPERALPTRTISLAVLTLWAASVLTGTVGLIVPDLQFRSLAEMVLPTQLTDVKFVLDQIHPDFGNSTELLGVTRPSALYSYTNSWGASVGMLIPLALYARQYLRSGWARAGFWAVMALSLVPVVVSVNRGLWVSIVVAALYVALRGALAGRPAIFVGVLLGAVGIGAAVFFSPLYDVLQKRLETPNVGTRETLVGAAVQLAADSPVIGYGAPVSVDTIADTNDVSVGTHGQLWTLLVSHGYPGVVLYFAFFLVVIVATWRMRQAAWWLQAAIVVLLTQSLFYNALPVPLVLAMIAVALCVRENAAGRAAHPPGPPVVRAPLVPRQSASSRPEGPRS